MKNYKYLIALLLGVVLGLFIGWLFWVRPVFATREPLACATQCIASECGTTEGTKMEVQESYEYANAICPIWYHYHNDGNWNQRCHRDFHWMHPEHKAPVACPEGFSQYEDSCRKVIQECVSVKCDDAQIIECEPTITPTPTEPVYEPEGRCPTECGIGGDIVPDGKGGTKTCPVNPGCSGGGSAPVCGDTAPVLLPGNPLVKRNGDDAIIQWQPTAGNKVNIYYYEVQHPENKHAVADLPNNGIYEVHLLGNKDWTFGIQQSQGCAGDGIVWIVDGNLGRWQLFVP